MPIVCTALVPEREMNNTRFVQGVLVRTRTRRKLAGIGITKLGGSQNVYV